jgi:hypothetical protein
MATWRVCCNVEGVSGSESEREKEGGRRAARREDRGGGGGTKGFDVQPFHRLYSSSHLLPFIPSSEPSFFPVPLASIRKSERLMPDYIPMSVSFTSVVDGDAYRAQIHAILGIGFDSQSYQSACPVCLGSLPFSKHRFP